MGTGKFESLFFKNPLWQILTKTEKNLKKSKNLYKNLQKNSESLVVVSAPWKPSLDETFPS